jgi:hypothetical protein
MLNVVCCYRHGEEVAGEEVVGEEVTGEEVAGWWQDGCGKQWTHLIGPLYAALRFTFIMKEKTTKTTTIIMTVFLGPRRGRKRVVPTDTVNTLMGRRKGDTQQTVVGKIFIFPKQSLLYGFLAPS